MTVNRRENKFLGGIVKRASSFISYKVVRGNLYPPGPSFPANNKTKFYFSTPKLRDYNINRWRRGQ
jgi:hypothetical protein